MSKKNRHKSRPPQRPSAPAAPKAGPATAAVGSAEDASTDGGPAREAPADEAGTGLHAASALAANAERDTGDTARPGSACAAATGMSGSEPSGEGSDRNVASADAAARAGPDAPAMAPPPFAFALPTPAPMASAGDIRGVLIQVAGARLLLPNATIAEVLSYADPEPVGEAAPAWLLGRLRWRGWQVPLIAFGTLAGVAQERAALGSKVVVLKGLAGTSRTPYFAMLTQGFPRLVTVSRQTLSVDGDEAMPPGVQARVRLNEDPALLPDLEAIEALVADAVAHAA